MACYNSLKKTKQNLPVRIISEWEEESYQKTFLKHSYEPFPQNN